MTNATPTAGWQIREALAWHVASLACVEDEDEAALVQGRIDEVLAAAEDKLGAYGAVVSRLGLEATALAERERSLHAARKRLEAAEARVREAALALALATEAATGKTQWPTEDGARCTLRRRTTEAVDVAPGAEARLPPEFVRVKREPDKVALKPFLVGLGGKPLVDPETGEVLADLVRRTHVDVTWK